MKAEVDFVQLVWDGRPVEIEYQWVGEDDPAAPLIVFLHEGLGSLSMWKTFPAQLCLETRCRGVVYSRPGYGRSTPRAADERWQPDFLHRQAHSLLPELLRILGIDTRLTPPWLFGHSDGGSIALLYATYYPQQIAGAILLSPHIVVEDLSIRSIEAARRAYEEADLKLKLARYHASPDSAFWGWNDIWLDPAFRRWSIEDELQTIACPLLAIQGLDDVYGTLEQVYGIARRVAQTEVVELPDCGHSPHLDQSDALIRIARSFILRQGSSQRQAGGGGRRVI